MHQNRRPERSTARRMTALATTVLLGVMAAPLSFQAQTPPFQTPLPMCYAPPSPDTDAWPVAVADSLGNTAGNAVTFAGSTLLSNDRGTSPSTTSRHSSGCMTGSPPAFFVTM